MDYVQFKEDSAKTISGGKLDSSNTTQYLDKLNKNEVS